MRKALGFFGKKNEEGSEKVKAFDEKVNKRLAEQVHETRIEEAFFIFGGTGAERQAFCAQLRLQHSWLAYHFEDDDFVMHETIMLLTDKPLWSGQTGEYIRDLAVRQKHIYRFEVVVPEAPVEPKEETKNDSPTPPSPR